MILALKLLLSPVLIAIMSLVGQRFGHTAAGLLAGFPFVAGPIFIVLVLEQGPHYGQQAGLAALMGVLCLAAFCLVYAWLAQRRHWLLSLLAGWASFGLAGALLTLWPLTPLLALLLAILVPVVVPSWFPPIRQPVSNGTLDRVELLTRMASAAVLVFSLTTAAHYTSPVLAGVLTPFPVASSVLAVFSHRRHGPLAAIQSLRGVMSGMYGFVSFFALSAWLLPRVGAVLAITAGIAAALAVQCLVFFLTHRRLPVTVAAD